MQIRSYSLTLEHWITKTTREDGYCCTRMTIKTQEDECHRPTSVMSSLSSLRLLHDQRLFVQTKHFELRDAELKFVMEHIQCSVRRAKRILDTEIREGEDTLLSS